MATKSMLLLLLHKQIQRFVSWCGVGPEMTEKKRNAGLEGTKIEHLWVHLANGGPQPISVTPPGCPELALN